MWLTSIHEADNFYYAVSAIADLLRVETFKNTHKQKKAC